MSVLHNDSPGARPSPRRAARGRHRGGRRRGARPRAGCRSCSGRSTRSRRRRRRPPSPCWRSCVNVNVTSAGATGPVQAAAVIVALCRRAAVASWTVTVSVSCWSDAGPSITSGADRRPVGRVGVGVELHAPSVADDDRRRAVVVADRPRDRAWSRSLGCTRRGRARAAHAGWSNRPSPRPVRQRAPASCWRPSPAGTFHVERPAGAVPLTDSPVVEVLQRDLDRLADCCCRRRNVRVPAAKSSAAVHSGTRTMSTAGGTGAAPSWMSWSMCPAPRWSAERSSWAVGSWSSLRGTSARASSARGSSAPSEVAIPRQRTPAPRRSARRPPRRRTTGHEILHGVRPLDPRSCVLFPGSPVQGECYLSPANDRANRGRAGGARVASPAGVIVVGVVGVLLPRVAGYR